MTMHYYFVTGETRNDVAPVAGEANNNITPVTGKGKNYVIHSFIFV